MSGREVASGSRFRTAALPLALAAAGLLAAGCGPEAGPGEAGGSAADTVAPASADTLAGADTVAADTAAGADTAGADAVRADTAPRATVGDTSADTVAPDTAIPDSVERRWSPGGYMVYVRRGESPDSVAADHGVEPDTVLAGLPGFYARLTAEQAAWLSRDARVRELARQIEERRPMDEPRGLPTLPDTADGGGG